MTDITAQNTFTLPLNKRSGSVISVSIAGTFVATVVVQRSRDNINWVDVDSFTVPAEKDAITGSGWYWRAGVKTGGYTSGTAVVNVY